MKEDDVDDEWDLMMRGAFRVTFYVLEMPL